MKTRSRSSRQEQEVSRQEQEHQAGARIKSFENYYLIFII